MKNKICALCFFVVFGLSLTACSPAKINYKFFVVSASEEPDKKHADKFSLLIGPMKIHSLINRPEIIKDVKNSQVFFFTEEEWGTDIEDNLYVVVSDYLGAVFPGSNIVNFNEPVLIDVDYQLKLSIRHLNVVDSNKFKVLIHWQLLDKRNSNAVLNGVFAKVTPIDDTRAETIVKHTEKALFDFTTDLGERINAATL